MYTEEIVHKLQINSQMMNIDYCKVTIVYKNGVEFARDNWGRGFVPCQAHKDELKALLADNPAMQSIVDCAFTEQTMDAYRALKEQLDNENK